MKLKLISFATCPFVQRAVIALNEKKVEHEVEYIDVKNKPDWFLKISPRGKVPLLIVDDTILFESQAIVEFIDEVTGDPKLMPSDPVFKARDRAWCAFGAEDLFMRFYTFIKSPTKEGALEEFKFLKEKLSYLDNEMKGRQFLSGNGKTFGLADLALTPFFFKANRLKDMKKADLYGEFSNLTAWAENLLHRDSVIHSVPENYPEAEHDYFKSSDSWLFHNTLLN